MTPKLLSNSPPSLHSCTLAVLLFLVACVSAQSRDSNCRNPVNPCDPNTNYFPQSETIAVQFASTIRNVSYSNTFVDITATGRELGHIIDYRIIQCGCPRPPGSENRIVLFTDPLSLHVHESPSMALLQALDSTLETLSYITSVTFVFSPDIHAKVANSEIIEAKLDNGSVDFETLLADSQLSASVIGSFQFDDFRERTGDLPLLVVPDAFEESPLGRAEFVKVLGVFLGVPADANALFERIVTEYQDASSKAQEAVRRPSVLLNRPRVNATAVPFGEALDISRPVDEIYEWSLPHRGQYITDLLDDANADYILERELSSETFVFPFSEVIEDFKFARFHIFVGHFPANRSRDTLEEYMNDLIDLNAPDSRARDAMATLNAVKCDNVYHRDKRVTSDGSSNDFFESGIINPDEILKDLVSILHPSVDFGDREMMYMDHFAAETDEFARGCPYNDFVGPPPDSKIYVDNEFTVAELNRFDIEGAWESKIQPELQALGFDAEYDILFEPENRADESDDETQTIFMLRALTDRENEAQLKETTELRAALARALDRDVGQLNPDGSIIPIDDGLSSAAIALIVIGSIAGAALLVWVIFRFLLKQDGKSLEAQEVSRDQYGDTPVDEGEATVENPDAPVQLI